MLSVTDACSPQLKGFDKEVSCLTASPNFGRYLAIGAH